MYHSTLAYGTPITTSSVFRPEILFYGLLPQEYLVTSLMFIALTVRHVRIPSAVHRYTSCDMASIPGEDCSQFPPNPKELRALRSPRLDDDDTCYAFEGPAFDRSVFDALPCFTLHSIAMRHFAHDGAVLVASSRTEHIC